MTLAQTYYHPQGGPFYGDSRSYYSRNHDISTSTALATAYDSHYSANFDYIRNYNNTQDSKNYRDHIYTYSYHADSERAPPFKRRKFSNSSWENTGQTYEHPCLYGSAASKHPNIYGNSSSSKSNIYENAHLSYENCSTNTVTTRFEVNGHTSTSSKRNRSIFEEDDEVIFMSKDDIERYSPSRKDGIDAVHEAHLRYSYCAFLQNLGLQLELPQTTIGTAMVLCHRFFLRRSHACHDRFLVATAALFLAAKSEETPCPLNNVLRVSCEIFHNKDFTFLSYVLPVDWFEQYRERIIEAEQMILTTLNFELNVQHPYETLTSTLEKLGFSQTVLVHLALSLVSEGVYRRINVLASLIFLPGG